MENTLSKYKSPKQRNKLDVVEHLNSLKEQKHSTYNSFYETCELTKEYIHEKYKDSVERDKHRNDFVPIYHEAMIGKPNAVNIIKKDIQDYLSKNGYSQIQFPSYYPTLVDAIYEVTFGWGPLAVFKYRPEAEGIKAIGVDIKLKTTSGYERLDFTFRNLQEVEEICHRLSNIDKYNKLNRFNSPELETRTNEGYRVSIMIPDRKVGEPSITFRRQIVKKPSFEQQAELGTIPKEAIEIFEILALLEMNSTIAGPPQSGKSTMLMTFLKQFAYSGLGTLYCEKNPEFIVRDIFPRSDVDHVLADGEEFEKIVSASLLRQDITNVLIGEIREYEAGLYRRASLQGIKKVSGTLHDSDPLDIPEILTSLYMLYNSISLDFNNVYRIFARNVHFSVSMSEISPGQRRVTSVQFYDFDSKTSELKMYKIMNYDEELNSWGFCSFIPERLKRIAKQTTPKEMQILQNKLSLLEKKYPMVKQEKVTIGHCVR
ncbi:hypothetical protein BKP35_16520 [Anaerobacillus arseniciselenatis]|uniref:Bacterial type II secretion system protein E domain-containing protein n=1 Tax=Anaerobacillus arseniciselenatis TaxID=85682 RepID=A0A1S2LAD9_9BACI|nr:ATPase, T2SS/T4P/T4SS family [Anaerobacillus arseniciselenatis]OIJ09458.1 hypothetical protein BKP35_16520 [Anaerobacillus arseniciselenatis]